MTDKKTIKATFDGGPWDQLFAIVSVDKFKQGKVVLDDTGHYPDDDYDGTLYHYKCVVKRNRAYLELSKVENYEED